VAAVSVAATVFAVALAAAGSDGGGDTVSDAMVERSLPEAGGRNVVNVILVDFRGLDTLIEITVLVAAAIGSVALARAGRRPRAAGGAAAETAVTVAGRPSPAAGAAVSEAVVDTRGRAGDAADPAAGAAAGGGRVERLVIVDVAVRLVFPAVMVGSIYLLFAGHNQPGGGFVGGIVAGAAVALRYVAGGIDEVRRLSRAHPWTVLGAGMLLATLTAVVPVLLGAAPLESAIVEVDLPLLGHVKVTSGLPFDVGVYLVVLGLVLMVFESFGDPPRHVTTPIEADAEAVEVGSP
jgi:multicomponent Na+:H+ antiporter subunit A